jgi:hypothetical protein
MTQAAQTSTPTTAWRLEVPPFVRCRPDASLAQKVDSSPGLEGPARQGLAELVTCEKTAVFW